jgi:hypothetical protein
VTFDQQEVDPEVAEHQGPRKAGPATADYEDVDAAIGADRLGHALPSAGI